MNEEKQGEGEASTLPSPVQEQNIVSNERTPLQSQEQLTALRQQAQQCLSDRHWTEAALCFQALLQHDSQDEAVLIGLATALDRLNTFEALYEVAGQLLELDPTSAPGMAFKARALQKMERVSEATIANDQALLLDTHLGLAWINRCGLQLLQGKFPEALRSSYRAIELAADDPRAWANKGMALLNFNRLAESLEAFDRSLELEPTQLFALQMKCEILGRIGRMREIIPLIHRALEINPHDVSALTQGIQAMRTLEMYEAMQELTRRLIDLHPDNLFAWENYMRSLRGQGKFEEANEALDRILEMDPADIRFWTLKADTLYRLERYREAAGIAERARRLDQEYLPARRIHEKALKLMYQRKDRKKLQR